jgi:hypothetical protein
MFRSWPALLMWGAGLTHLALGAAIVRSDGGVAATVALAASLAIGASEIVWGAAALRSGRAIAPRLIVGAALAALAVGGALLIVGASPLAIAAASGFAVSAAAITVRTRGSRARHAETAPATRSSSSVAGLLVGAILVAGVATPALATTDAGIHGVSHDRMTPLDPHLGH